MFGILVCSMLGGMRAVTWTQVAQYIVLIVAYLIPIFWMSIAQGFGFLPHLSYGSAVQRIMELEPLIGVGTTVDTVAVSGVDHPARDPPKARWRRGSS
jgi:cation/acetate symporter